MKGRIKSVAKRQKKWWKQFVFSDYINDKQGPLFIGNINTNLEVYLEKSLFSVDVLNVYTCECIAY